MNSITNIHGDTLEDVLTKLAEFSGIGCERPVSEHVAAIVTRSKQEIVDGYETLLSAYSGRPKGTAFNLHIDGIIEKRHMV